MFSEIRMMLMFVVLTTIICTSSTKTIKKVTKDTKTGVEEIVKTSSKPAVPAIIAIQIVDPNENKTSKTSKRTIDSSLGYGYQNSFGVNNKPPRLEYYKYSQHDIPPYRGNVFSSSGQGQSYDVQKSIEYNLGTQTTRTHVPVYRTAYPMVPAQNLQSLTQYYQPGTMLYSTINQDGQLARLTESPHQYQGQGTAVPVILLKVYPSQLANADGGLYPNLPQSHPHSALNSINLQSLLSNYLQNILQQSLYPEHEQQAYQEPQYQHQQPQYQHQPPQYQHQQPQYQQYQYVQMPTLPTYENYPDEAHTRVIFHHKNGHIAPTPTKQPLKTKTITVQLPQNVEVPTQAVQYYDVGGQDGGQGYYYDTANQIGDGQNYYYTQDYATQMYEEPNDTTEAPFNYHAHSNSQNSRRNKKRTSTNSKNKTGKRQE